jgi:hypothetical protein
MNAKELRERYEFYPGWSHEEILDTMISFMRKDELDYYISILDSVAEQVTELESA